MSCALPPVPGKRGFDLLIGLLALALLLPAGLAIAVAIRCCDGPPVLFRQARLGRGGRCFQLLKFRSMRPGAGRLITVGQDPRITRLGAWLRRTRCDELPQLVNVLAGDMHLVGPRPEVPRYHQIYDQGLLTRRPGLADPAALAWRDEARLLALAIDPETLYRQRILPDKLRRSRRFAAGESLSAGWRILVRAGAGRSA